MSLEILTSFSNPKIKYASSLHDSKTRRAEGRFIIEGPREIQAAIRAKVSFGTVFVCPELITDATIPIFESIKDRSDLKVFSVNEKLYEKISYGEKMEGLAVIAKNPSTSRALPEKPQSGVWLVLENLEKPGNIGAILRTADGAGVAGIILNNASSDLYHPNIIRSSQGSIFYHPLHVATVAETVAWLKTHKITSMALTPEGSKNLYTVDLKSNVAVVFGTEHEGLSPEWLKAADQRIKIPMNGKIDALNVSVSVAVVLYEAVRQNNK